MNSPQTPLRKEQRLSKSPTGKNESFSCAFGISEILKTRNTYRKIISSFCPYSESNLIYSW